MIDALKEILGEQPSLLKTRVRPGPKIKFTDIDIIALSLTADHLALNSENYLFAALNSDYKECFPNLLSRRQYHDRRKNLKKEIIYLQGIINRKMEKPRKSQDIYVIDSMPLKICKMARMFRSTICKDDSSLIPKESQCWAQDESYYGFKLNVVCTGEGVIKKFKVDDSTRHDIHYLDEIGDDFKGCRIVGDKGYISKGRKQELLDTYNIHLETPFRKNQKNPKPFIYGKVRKRIETLFSQLNIQFDIQRNFAKTTKGYLTRLYSKLCTITLLQYINKSKGKPIGQVQYALI
ncbi:IS982 family transposase [Mucilaginibacter sabulilitoris]|uniref:IS982 family transposase n=1 Tax=Mucilaginibacter sabulilitoris TaxID=1173583 RepID=A0ABZ0TD14_9SPHI|nr:IS982 family transposase [Mucilaginibacter sabulilitoris]WPU91109.1 IS982 family transposase [Mucilaginibacter sabulilitoris]